ncbi:MAG: amidohydrolase family protein [Paracoccaceae bacterium]|nr:amidohydrolase family protein [Paracoccaceae bacterium]
MKIVDFRLRPPLRGYLDTIMYSQAARRDRITGFHGMTPARSAQEKSIEMLLKDMDEAGVTRGVAMGRYSGPYGTVSNEDVAAIVRDYPGRFIGVASIDPTDRRKAIRQIEDAKAAGLTGVNIEPGAYPMPLYADDRRLYPIYAYCEDNNVPVVMMAGGSAGPDLSYTMPVHVDRVAGDFPKMKLAISHGGWPWVHEILHVAFRRENVYLSPDQYLCGMPGTDEYVRAANGYLSDRFLYASSYPFLCVKAYLAWFRTLPIREAVMENLLCRNAEAFLGVRAETAARAKGRPSKPG